MPARARAGVLAVEKRRAAKRAMKCVTISAATRRSGAAIAALDAFCAAGKRRAASSWFTRKAMAAAARTRPAAHDVAAIAGETARRVRARGPTGKNGDSAAATRNTAAASGMASTAMVAPESAAISIQLW